MGSLRRPDFDQWKSYLYLVVFAVIILAGETSTSPVSSLPEHYWQQVNSEPHSVSKRATRSESLQNLRSLLRLKRKTQSSQEGKQQLSANSKLNTNVEWRLGDITRLMDLLNTGNDELSRFSSSYASPSTADAAESPNHLASFSEDTEEPKSFDLEDNTRYGRVPYNNDDSYSHSQELPTSSSSSSSQSHELNGRLRPRLETKRAYSNSYTNRWSRSRSRSRTRSRYNYIKRVLPCYLNVVTCY